MKAKTAAPFDPVAAMVHALTINSRITDFLVKHLDAHAWRAEPPGGKGRTVAAIVAHIHNVRVMWLKEARGKVPAQLDRATVTVPQARKALAQSHVALEHLISAALKSDGRIHGFKPDAAPSLAT